MLFQALLFATLLSAWPALHEDTRAAREKAASAAIDKIFAPLVKKDQPGAAVLVARAGVALHRKGYGLANVAEKTPITPETSFYLASVSKQFTAMGVMIAQEQGLLDVSDSLRDYFPEFPEEWGAVTIQHMLTHTSGIPDHFRLTSDLPGLSNERVIDLLLDHGKLNFEPGKEFRYSNGAYVLLSEIVAMAADMPYREFMAENVFDKLKMDQTLVFDETEPEVVNRVQGYVPKTLGHVETDYELFTTGAGGMFSTIDDLMRWDQALYGEELIGNDTYAEMIKPRAEMSKGQQYAYGWIISEHRGRTIIGHSGGLMGFATFLGRCPSEKLCVVILSNVSAGANLGQIGLQILDQYIEEEPGESDG